MLSTTDDDKTERILPDIEDNQEIESLLVRYTNRVENNKNSAMEVEEPAVETQESCSKSVVCEENNENEVGEIVTCSNKVSFEEIADTPKHSTSTDKDDADEPQDLSISEPQPSNEKQLEVERMNHLLNHVESEFSNVELTREGGEENCEKIDECEQNSFLNKDDHLEKLEDDETGSVSYHKENSEPIECKIIVSHEESDASSIASSDSPNCDLEIKKISSSYQPKYSRSAPNSPVVKRKFYRSLSRASLRSDFDRSNENLCPYPIGFEATSLQDYLKDNYNDEDMEIEEPQHHSYMKLNGGIIVERTRSHASLSTSMSGISVLKARCSKIPSSPVSIQSNSSYGAMEEDEDDSDAASCASYHSNEKDDEEDQLLASSSHHHMIKCEFKRKDKKDIDSKGLLDSEILQQDQPMDFRSQSLISSHYSSAHFAVDHRQHTIVQHQEESSIHQEIYPVSSSTSQNLLNVSECIDPSTSIDSKSCSSSNKSCMQKPSAELLNINEDAHAGPVNVFEFDGLQILVPSTFISDSSQKAVSGTSQQSLASSENGAGNDEEVKSVNMRADETMPPRGELSEQESNGCTEQSWPVRKFKVYYN